MRPLFPSSSSRDTGAVPGKATCEQREVHPCLPSRAYSGPSLNLQECPTCSQHIKTFPASPRTGQDVTHTAWPEPISALHLWMKHSKPWGCREEICPRTAVRSSWHIHKHGLQSDSSGMLAREEQQQSNPGQEKLWLGCTSWFFSLHPHLQLFLLIWDWWQSRLWVHSTSKARPGWHYLCQLPTPDIWNSEIYQPTSLATSFTEHFI